MLLLRNVVLVHPGHPSDSRPIDLLLQDGRLHRLEPGGSMPTQGHTVAEAEDLHVSLSWIDTLASLNIPGHELRDSLEHLSASALQGGFSHVVVSPNSHPPIDHAEAVLALLARAATLPTTLLPMGAASEGTQGKEMAELASMQQAGACLISDGWQPLQAAGLQYRILRYLAPLQLPMHQLPMLESLEAGGVANESPAITRLGLKASPILAETLAVQQLLELLRHTEAELYLCPITAADSVARIRQAKADGLRVTAGTLPAYLYFTDEQLGDFDTRYKLRPPLRSEQDRLALLEAVADGTLDILASGHSPATIDEKRLEFDFAAYGMPMLETCYACASTALEGYAEVETLVRILGLQPRKLLRMPIPAFEPGAELSLTLFQPRLRWTATEKHLKTLYNSNPTTGHTLKGKAYGVYHKGVLHKAH